MGNDTKTTMIDYNIYSAHSTVGGFLYSKGKNIMILNDVTMDGATSTYGGIYILNGVELQIINAQLVHNHAVGLFVYFVYSYLFFLYYLYFRIWRSFICRR